MIQREREVSTSKAREETVAAVSNTITPRTSIFYLMSNTLGLCETNIHIRDSLLMCRFRQIVKNGACLKEIRGKRANIEHSRTNEMLFRKTSQCHSSDVAMTKKGKKQEQTRNCVWLRLCTRSLVITNLFQSKCYRMYHISYLSLPLELKSCDQHNFSQNELIHHNAKRSPSGVYRLISWKRASVQITKKHTDTI